MRNKVGSNVNANATEIVTSEELKIFIAKLTTIYFHVSFFSSYDPNDHYLTCDDLQELRSSQT